MSSTPHVRGTSLYNKEAKAVDTKKQDEQKQKQKQQQASLRNILIGLPMVLAALCLGLLVPSGMNPFSRVVGVAAITVPPQAQVIDQKSFNVLGTVPPPYEANSTTIFVWPDVTADSLTAKPFHVYHDEFYDIIGTNPTLTIVATSRVDPLFHEAVVWSPATNEVFFVQNAGSPKAGTGLRKSSIIQKISLAEADAAKNERNATGNVTVSIVPSKPQVINPNGGTNYKGEIAWTGEGQGDNVAPALYLMNPVEPYNTTVLLNNYFGRQFSSLNDLAVHPLNKDIYFTDTLYGYLQDFRPTPGLQNQVYRFNEMTGAVTVVADGFTLPNGFAFSPDGQYAYVSDTGVNQGNWGYNQSAPATIYRYDVQQDGTFVNRKTFAYTSPGVPDGVHCDSKGNVYAGLGDGVHVWNPSGTLLGKIYLGTTSANFQFAGEGRMVICAETELYYVTLAAKGGPVM